MDLTLDYSLLIVVFTAIIDIVCSHGMRLPILPEMPPCVRKCLAAAVNKNEKDVEETKWNFRDEDLYKGILPFCSPYEYPDLTESACYAMKNFTNCVVQTKTCPSGTISKKELGALEQFVQHHCSIAPKAKAMSEIDRNCSISKCGHAYDKCNSTCISAMDDAAAKQKPTQESDKERVLRKGCDLWLCGFDCVITEMTASCGQGAKLPLEAQKGLMEVSCRNMNVAIKDPDSRGGGCGGTRSNGAWVIAVIMISFMKA